MIVQLCVMYLPGENLCNVCIFVCFSVPGKSLKSNEFVQSYLDVATPVLNYLNVQSTDRCQGIVAAITSQKRTMKLT